jgi:amidase
MQRRTFLGVVPGAVAACATATQRARPAPPAPPAFELDEVSLAELAQRLAAGTTTSQRLLELYLSRIAAIDRAGPELRAIIELNPDAPKLAHELDQERRAGRIRGALHGIPILIKDNIDTADRMSTSAGSFALEGWHPPKDAFVAARLRAAGALILGKSNLSEWANIRSAHSVSGWSARGGQTRNPYALRRNPSGSSSGSGVAVAANLCAAAVGTETDGSIVSPASVCGVVGVKPTLGLCSRSGIVPIAHSQDTAGPIARTVRDAALLLTAMAGADPEDAASATTAQRPAVDYTQSLDASGLRGARLGIARKFFEDNARLDHFLSGCVDVLRKGGAEIVDPADLATHGKWGDAEFLLLQYELKHDLSAYLARLPHGRPVRSFPELIAFNRQNRAREMPIFEQEIFDLVADRGPLTDPKYIEARRDCQRLARTEGIDATLARHKLDALVTLTNGPAWLTDVACGDPNVPGCSSAAAVAGYPHITVPAGLFGGLPIGLSFFGAPFSEPLLFRLAYGFETATQARRKPEYGEGA